MFQKSENENESNNKKDFRKLDLDDKFNKIVYIIESKEERKERLKYELNKKIKKSEIENINNINNCGSLYIQDFDIKYLNKEENNKKQICNFKPLNENINPFFSEKYDLSVKRFIELKNIQNKEENLNNILIDIDFD